MLCYTSVVYLLQRKIIIFLDETTLTMQIKTIGKERILSKKNIFPIKELLWTKVKSTITLTILFSFNRFDKPTLTKKK